MAVVFSLMVCTALWAANQVDENGYYFINDFESNIPDSSPAEETAIYVEGQGEWLFLKAFVSTNSSYVRSGKQNLRLYKNGSYVVTPVLDKGVKDLMPEQFTPLHEGMYYKVQSVLDFISNMTDLYAVQLYKDLRGID